VIEQVEYRSDYGKICAAAQGENYVTYLTDTRVSQHLFEIALSYRANARRGLKSRQLKKYVIYRFVIREYDVSAESRRICLMSWLRYLPRARMPPLALPNMPQAATVKRNNASLINSPQIKRPIANITKGLPCDWLTALLPPRTMCRRRPATLSKSKQHHYCCCRRQDYVFERSFECVGVALESDR